MTQCNKLKWNQNKTQREPPLSCTPCTHTHTQSHNLSPFSPELSILAWLARASSWAGRKGVLWWDRGKNYHVARENSNEASLTYSISKEGNTQKPLIPTMRAPHRPRTRRKKPTFELNTAPGHHCFNLLLDRLKPTPHWVGWGQGISHLWLIWREVFPNCKDHQWNQIGKSLVTEIQNLVWKFARRQESLYFLRFNMSHSLCWSIYMAIFFFFFLTWLSYLMATLFSGYVIQPWRREQPPEFH